MTETERWISGAPVVAYAWRAERPKANLLLTHGYGEYAERYVTGYHGLIPALNAAGISVFAFDMPGHGRTPGPRGATDLKRTVSHHLAARETLKVDKRPLFLMGHSLGGLVTAASAAHDPDGVSGVVLSAPALEIPANPVLKAVAGAVAAIAPTARLTAALDADGISRNAAVVEAYRDNPMVIKRAPAARLGATAFKVQDRAWREFGDWQLPVLIVHGDADRLVPIKGSRRFIETIPARDKTLEEFAGGYHELLNDHDRDRALETILGWLKARIG
ncbi:alpha/beta hydrolase [Henriciella sp.]|uniref:alpha/beta hydrolase n=1 Tax=Henriciella sp. TaxID=1968823 RepID=UPI002604606A|nr:alpha/beta hydrolase [Henriciella sp.]